MQSSIAAWLFVFLQRLLPSRALGKLVRALAYSSNPYLSALLIRAFARTYAVDLSQAACTDLGQYPTFNAFFTRRLRPGARPVDPDPHALVSPADGTLQQLGPIVAGRLLQAKGVQYSLADLLGGSRADADVFAQGFFATVYLAPRDYHGVHMPLEGEIRAMTYVPGARWAVNATTVGRVPGIFSRNERLICHAVGPGGRFAVIFVAALNVGGISTVWSGEVLPHRERRPCHWTYGADAPRLAKGALLGTFHMGSTVIVLTPGAPPWQATRMAGAAVLVGQALATLPGRPP